MGQGFAIWITGLPASGKSTLARAMKRELNSRNIRAVQLESDELRKILTPHPTYTDDERDRFYEMIAQLAKLFVEQDLVVIVDATAHRRAYRDAARRLIPEFFEVYVDCPLDVCLRRDPKGIYRSAVPHGSVPGLQTPYEPPVQPDAVYKSIEESPESAARRIVNLFSSPASS